jgi:hypothetical protein
MPALREFLFNKDIGVRCEEGERLVLHIGTNVLEALVGIAEAAHVVYPTVSATTGVATLGAGTVAGVTLAAAGPVLGMAGVFMALGSGYAEARELIHNEAIASGFSQGFVCGLLNMSTGTTVRLFAQHGVIHRNPMDSEADIIEMKARNRGLVAGYVMANQASEDEKKAFLREIREYAGHVPSGDWTDRDKIDYVITYAAKLRLHFLHH